MSKWNPSWSRRPGASDNATALDEPGAEPSTEGPVIVDEWAEEGIQGPCEPQKVEVADVAVGEVEKEAKVPVGGTRAGDGTGVDTTSRWTTSFNAAELVGPTFSIEEK